MSKKAVLDAVKAFGMTQLLLNDDLGRIEKLYGIELGNSSSATTAVDDIYYPQFDQVVRKEASEMSRHYAVFYSLEKTVRKLVAQAMEASRGLDWWDQDCVPKMIHDAVAERIDKEINAGISRRSYDELDYTTFGELSVLINTNSEAFGGIFTSKRAVEKVMATLNTLRNPIAHCSPLAEDEILRLNLTLRDWFRLQDRSE